MTGTLIMFVAPVAFIGLVVLVLALERYANTKKVSGKVLATIITSTGTKVEGLVPYDGKAAWVKLDGDKIVPVKPPSKIDPKKATKQARDLIGSGLYMFDESSLIREWWPYRSGFNKFLSSIEVRQAIWREGNPEPLTSPSYAAMIERATEIAMQNQGEQIPGMVATPKLINAYCDQALLLTAAAMEEQYRELQDAFLSVTRKWINPVVVYVGLFLGLAGLIAAIVMFLMVRGELKDIKEILGL